MLGLHNLKKSAGSTHRKKRLGRGNASGHGTYSTRGLKGQRARSGGRGGLVQKGVRGYLLRIPKNRGFKSLRVQPQAISLAAVERLFAAGASVNLKTLRSHGLITASTKFVKLIGTSETLKKNLTVKVHAISAGARTAIEKAGGTVEIIPAKNTVEAKSESKA